MAEYGSELNEYNWNQEIIDTQEPWTHIWIQEVKFKSYSETHYCVAAFLDLLICVGDKK